VTSSFVFAQHRQQAVPTGSAGASSKCLQKNWKLSKAFQCHRDCLERNGL